MNSFGTRLRVTTFGESHGAAVGVVIDGLPAGFTIDRKFLNHELARRRPNGSSVSTSRIEPDIYEIVSGIDGDKTNGAPLAVFIKNQDQHPGDYSDIKEIFRPGHGDYGWYKKFGNVIGSGGGRLSGRETVARVIAGAIAKMLLNSSGISICGYTRQIGAIKAAKVDWEAIGQNDYLLPDLSIVPKVDQLISALRQAGDSVGGIVHIEAHGVPAGIGSPVFDKLDAQIAKAMLSIGGVKGILFGDGLDLVVSNGSQVNDAMGPNGPLTNHAGGIVGGISNGAVISFDLIVKPVPTISASQQTMDINGQPRKISLSGRHDCCLCPRLEVVAESMLALVLADELI